jgi:MtN3 and saliva related transmembrane protein
MQAETLIGIGASVFTSTSMIPQLVKVIREKESEDISIAMLVVLFTGLALWIWYGALKDDLIIVISNAFALLVNFSLVCLSLKYKQS